MLVENEMKKLRSPACSRQTKRNFLTPFHTTGDPPFRDSLYASVRQTDRIIPTESSPVRRT